MIDLGFGVSRPAGLSWDWPNEVPEAPAELARLIAAAHDDFDAADRDCMAKAPNETLAALVWWWLNGRTAL